MKVVWTANAVAQLHAIRTYISQDSERYAVAMIDRITSRSSQIANHPYSGTRVAEYDRPDVREVLQGSYRIIYRIHEHQIDVLTVLHGARQLPTDLT